VGQLVKGKVETGGAIKVYILGGRVKEPIPIKMHVPGAPKVGQGEEMVLFLESRGGKKPYHRFVGMRQGRVPVFTDPKTGEKHVRYGERIKGVRMVDRDGKPLPPNAQLGPAKAGSLDGFVGRVHQIIATQAARPRTTTTRPADEPAPRRNPQPASKEGGK